MMKTLSSAEKPSTAIFHFLVSILLLTPLITPLCHTACAVMGVIALQRDFSVQDTPCGQSTHIVKHCGLNSIVIIVANLTYFTFPGGGEGARARALALIMFTTALLVWGIFLLSNLQAGCNHVIASHYPSIFMFLKTGMAHNGLFASFLIAHETWLGAIVGSDLTLSPQSLCLGNEAICEEDHQEDAESRCGESEGDIPDAEVGQMMAPKWDLAVDTAEDHMAVVVAPIPFEGGSMAQGPVVIPARIYTTDKGLA